MKIFNKKLKIVILKYRYRFLPVKPDNNILIFGDPRGGSTWLSELIKQIFNYPILWEPLYLRENQEFKNIGFSWRQYIPENSNWYEAKLKFTDLFCGRIQNHWLNKRNKFLKVLFARHFIIKFCRANILLPYLTKEFRLNYKPIYIIRHPFAVVASQLRYGSWQNFQTFEIPWGKFDFFFSQHLNYLKNLRTREECLVAMWCLTNGYVLKHKKNNVDWITIQYEELYLNPDICLKRIMKEWKLNKHIENINYKKPSNTTRFGNNLGSVRQLYGWKDAFNKDSIEKMSKVLEYFNIEDYDTNLMPKKHYS